MNVTDSCKKKRVLDHAVGIALFQYDISSETFHLDVSVALEFFPCQQINEPPMGFLE